MRDKKEEEKRLKKKLKEIKDDIMSPEDIGKRLQEGIEREEPEEEEEE